MKKFHFIICLYLLPFLFNSLEAQEDAPLRIELEVMENDMPFTVLPLGERGVAVVMDQNDLGKSNTSRSIVFYDKYLIKRFTTDIIIENAYSYKGYKQEGDSLYFILTTLPNTYKQNQIGILTLSLSTGEYSLIKYTLNIESKVQILYAQLFANELIFLGRNKNTYTLYNYNIKTDDLQFTTLTDSDKLDWCSGRMDERTRTIYMIFRDAKLQDRELTFMSYNFSLQNSISKKIIAPTDEIRLTDAIVEVMDTNNILLMGSFHYAKEKQQNSTYDRGTQSSGVFTAILKEGEVINWNVKKYTDFKKVDSLLSPQAHKELQDAQKKAKGKTTIIPYLSLLRTRQYLGITYLISEVYRREETTTTDTYYDTYGRLVPYTRTIFDGFSFQDAFVLAIDSNGKPIEDWVYDASLSAKKNALSSFIDFIPDGMGNICFAHNDLGRLMYRSFNEDHRVSPSQSMILEMISPFDKLEATWENHFVHWYEDYALIYGYQQIINNQRKGKGRRNVFYLSRIVVNE